MRNRLLKSFTTLTACLLVLAFAAATPAQFRDRQFRDREMRDQYGRAITRTNVDALIRRAENRSDQFARTLQLERTGNFFERIFERGDRQDRIEDRVAEQARALETQLDLVRQEVDRTGDYYAVRSQVDNALSTARRIERTMSNRQLDNRAERQWMLLRADMNRLARVFHLPLV